MSAVRVEQALLPKMALLEAQGPGFDAEARLAELRRHLTATGSAGAGGSGTGGAGPSSGSGAAAAAFETELLTQEYIALRESASNMRTDSREDRFAVYDLAPFGRSSTSPAASSRTGTRIRRSAGATRRWP